MRAVDITCAWRSGAALPGHAVTPNCLYCKPCVSRRALSAPQGWRDKQLEHAFLRDKSTRPLVGTHAVSEAVAITTGPEAEEAEARIVAVVPSEMLSEIGNTDVTLEEVLAHMGRRLAFNNPAFQLRVFTDNIFQVTPLAELVRFLHGPR